MHTSANIVANNAIHFLQVSRIWWRNAATV